MELMGSQTWEQTNSRSTTSQLMLNLKGKEVITMLVIGRSATV